jgi:drug/metabolite transporter (DMT)-like permease
VNWIACGILTSSAWGAYVILLKKATSEQYYGLSSLMTFFIMSTGILFVSVTDFLLDESKMFFKQETGIAFASGLLRGIGMSSVIFAISSAKTLVYKLTPLYNTNTLVAVLLGILLLNGVPTQRVAIVAGAILVLLGR